MDNELSVPVPPQPLKSGIDIAKLQTATNQALAQEMKPVIIAKNVSDQVAAFREAGLRRQAPRIVYDARCDAAAAVGFVSLTDQQIFTILKGKPNTSDGGIVRTDFTSATPEYFYNDVTGVTYTHQGHASGPAVHPIDYHRRPFPYAPWRSWTMRLWWLSKLNADIPFEVLLKVRELKKLNLFNCFMAMGPDEAFCDDKPYTGDCELMIVAIIAEQCDDRQFITAPWTFYFIAKW